MASHVWQVTQRFRDNSMVEDLEQMGVRLDGMPDAGAPTIAHVSNADVRNTVQVSRDIFSFSQFT